MLKKEVRTKEFDGMVYKYHAIFELSEIVEIEIADLRSRKWKVRTSQDGDLTEIWKTRSKYSPSMMEKRLDFFK